MTVNLRPLHEINRDGYAALVRELGIVEALRFMSQFRTGEGDYTDDRKAYLGDETLDALYERVQEANRRRDG